MQVELKSKINEFLLGRMNLNKERQSFYCFLKQRATKFLLFSQSIASISHFPYVKAAGSHDQQRKNVSIQAQTPKSQRRKDQNMCTHTSIANTQLTVYAFGHIN